MKATRCIVISVAFVAVSAWAFGNQDTNSAAPESPFKGKFLSVEVIAREIKSHQLSDVVVKDLGGRSYLVGKSIHPEERYWAGGARIWIASNTITEIAEFDSLEELQRRFAKIKLFDSKANGVTR